MNNKMTALSQGLGGLSVALGVPALAGTSSVAEAIGAGDVAGRRLLLRMVGARELAVGVGLLAQPRRWMLWARVAGDAMDLALLGRLLAGGHRVSRPRAAVTTAVVSGITALDIVSALASSAGPRTFELHGAITVGAGRQEVYSRWRRFEDLPTFMAHVEQVTTTGPTSSHWTASAPFGQSVQWDAEIVDDTPRERIAWRSAPGADVGNEGEVRFADAPGGRGTEVRVTLRYTLPGGAVGEAAARYFGEDPHQQVDDDLRRFKQIVETGEVVRSDGAPGGKKARGEFPQRPARPMSESELEEELR